MIDNTSFICIIVQMINRDLSAIFRALSDPNRLAILARLADCGRPCSVGELSSCCPVDLSTVSRHLAVLREAGVLAAEKRGKHVYYSVLATGLADALRRLAEILERCCGDGCCTNKEEHDGQ